MGISIDLKFYNKEDLLKELDDWGTTDKDLTLKILSSCGTFIGDTYVLLNNEMGEGYSPYYNVSELLDSAFNKEDSFDIFLHSGKRGISSVELADVAEELGITLNEEEGDEDEE